MHSENNRQTALRNSYLFVLVVMVACGGSPSEPGSGNSGNSNTPTVVQLQLADSPRYTNQADFSLSGSTTGSSTVTVNGGSAATTAVANAQGAFTVSVPLNLNQANNLTITATAPTGLSSTPLALSVTHDDVSPTLSVQHPSDSLFDTDGDFRVNIAFGFDDNSSGIEVISVTNDRALGGGASIGGVDAGSNLMTTAGGGSLVVGPDTVSYNASLEAEFPLGANTLTLSVTDSAGNAHAETVEFEVSGTEPSFTMTQPTDGDLLVWPGFVIAGQFSDVAGKIDQSGLTFVADKPLIALMSQDGTQAEGAEAGENFSQLFTFSDTTAELRDEGLHAFPAGDLTITGQVADRTGTRSQSDSVTVTFPEAPHTLLVVNSTSAPGATEHVVPIGLTSFQGFGGVQFSLNFDPEVLTVDSLSSEGRAPSTPFFEMSAGGQLNVILVDLSGDPIPLGSGIVINIYTSVGATAAVQDLALTISDVEVANQDGNPVDVTVWDGVLAIR